MIIQNKNNQVFNLMDTNGRRSDVLNALDIYLNILKTESSREGYKWAAFPNNLSQFHFYHEAIKQSPEIFESHPKFDNVYLKLKKEIELYEVGNKKPLEDALCDKNLRDSFDVDIESRARHYSSNLCKLGLCTSNRVITDAGYSFLGDKFKKDEIEELLPLNNANISILRQLLKLKIFTIDINGKRKFYSPLKMALYLLLQDKYQIDNEMFSVIVQSLSPYRNNLDIDTIIEQYKDNNKQVYELNYEVPSVFEKNELISFEDFNKYIKNSKSSKIVNDYYELYLALYKFNLQRTEFNFVKLTDLLKDENKKDKYKKAFGFGKNIFEHIDGISLYGMNSFLLYNSENELLKIEGFNSNFYSRYIISKYLDQAREYSDTTKRMLKATGLFRFDKALPILSYKEILSQIFDINELKKTIFGTVSNDEYMKYEGNDSLNCYYYSNHSITEILSFDFNKTSEVIDNIEKEYGVEREKLVGTVKDKTNADFINHINEKYTKEQILKILKLFDDRANDKIIKKLVNPEASVPTIYEYIIAIAWYYISDKQMDLFDSLNLTLNSEFEPILHAGGGMGDIVVKYNDLIVMLEVTLMDKNSQKRGEQEPVLRHSIDLKSNFMNVETITFFIANQLDFNTLSVWKSAANSYYESKNKTYINGVKIMAFTNSELCEFIDKGITRRKIVGETEKMFSSGYQSFDWRDRTVANILA